MHHVCMHDTFNSILPNLGEAMSTLGQLAAGSRCTLLLEIEHAVTELKRRGGRGVVQYRYLAASKSRAVLVEAAPDSA